MDEISYTRLWLARAGFAILLIGILFFQLLPLETTPRRFAGPDLILGFAFAWALRRPEYAPIGLTAALFLLADLLLGRPPGLYAALGLIAFASLRSRATSLRDMPFTVEWVTVTITLSVLMITYRLVLALTLVPVPPLGLAASQLALTVAAYPAVAAITRYVFGLRPVGIGEVNALGQRQ